VLKKKLASKPELLSAFEVICCGDDPDLRAGKPAPDCFLKVSRQLGIPPQRCLVVEDSSSGVEAAQRAGMHIIYVPSLEGRGGHRGTAEEEVEDGAGQVEEQVEAAVEEKQNSTISPAAAAHTVFEQLDSLLDFIPERYGLTPFPPPP